MTFLDVLRNFIMSNLFGLAVIIITPFLTWFFSRRKIEAEVKHTDADTTTLLTVGAGKLASSWEIFARNIEDRYIECMRKTDALSLKIDIVNNRNEDLEKKVNEYKRLNDELIIKMNDFMKRNQHLREYTERLVIFVETLLSQMEKTNPEIAQINKQELERLKVQFQNE